MSEHPALTAVEPEDFDGPSRFRCVVCGASVNLGEVWLSRVVLGVSDRCETHRAAVQAPDTPAETVTIP